MRSEHLNENIICYGCCSSTSWRRRNICHTVWYELTRLGDEIHWFTARMPNTKQYEFFHGIHIHRIPILFKNKFYFPGGQTFQFMLGLQKLDFVREMDVIQTNTLAAGDSQRNTTSHLAGDSQRNTTSHPSFFVMNSLENYGIRWVIISWKERYIKRSKGELRDHHVIGSHVHQNIQNQL